MKTRIFRLRNCLSDGEVGYDATCQTDELLNHTSYNSKSDELLNHIPNT